MQPGPYASTPKNAPMMPTTMVVVTHEMGFAREVGNRVLFMDDGKVLEQGSPAQLFGNPQNPRLQDFLSKVL